MPQKHACAEMADVTLCLPSSGTAVTMLIAAVPIEVWREFATSGIFAHLSISSHMTASSSSMTTLCKKEKKKVELIPGRACFTQSLVALHRNGLSQLPRSQT